MKRQYMKPQAEVIEIKHIGQLLTGSPIGGRVYSDEDAKENEYGL